MGTLHLNKAGPCAPNTETKGLKVQKRGTPKRTKAADKGFLSREPSTVQMLTARRLMLTELEVYTEGGEIQRQDFAVYRVRLGCLFLPRKEIWRRKKYKYLSTLCSKVQKEL